MKIRLLGTEAELGQAVGVLIRSGAFDVHEVSDFYPNRGNSKLGRVYVEAVVDPRGAVVRAEATRLDKPERPALQAE